MTRHRFPFTPDQLLDAEITVASARRSGLPRHELATIQDAKKPGEIGHTEPTAGCILCAATILAAEVERLNAILAAQAWPRCTCAPSMPARECLADEWGSE